MPILIALILSPTLTFYFYVLVQFWKEAHRRRFLDSCAGIVPLPSARVRQTEYNSALVSDLAVRAGADANAAAAPAPQPAADLAPVGPSERAKVIVTYLKNRLVVIPSGTGRLAAKRHAKG